MVGVFGRHVVLSSFDCAPSDFERRGAYFLSVKPNMAAPSRSARSAGIACPSTSARSRGRTPRHGQAVSDVRPVARPKDRSAAFLADDDPIAVTLDRDRAD